MGLYHPSMLIAKFIDSKYMYFTSFCDYCQKSKQIETPLIYKPRLLWRYHIKNQISPLYSCSRSDSPGVQITTAAWGCGLPEQNIFWHGWILESRQYLNNSRVWKHWVHWFVLFLDVILKKISLFFLGWNTESTVRYQISGTETSS